MTYEIFTVFDFGDEVRFAAVAHTMDIEGDAATPWGALHALADAWEAAADDAPDGAEETER